MLLLIGVDVVRCVLIVVGCVVLMCVISWCVLFASVGYCLFVVCCLLVVLLCVICCGLFAVGGGCLLRGVRCWWLAAGCLVLCVVLAGVCNVYCS